MSEENKTPKDNEELVDAVEEEEAVEEVTEAEEEAVEVVEETETKAADEKKGMNIWVAVLLGFALIAIIATIIGKNGKWMIDPDEWGQGGRRSYIWVEVDNVYQADQGANFSLSAPEEISGYSNKRYWIIQNYIYDIWYCDEESQAYTIVHKCKKNDLLEADKNVYLQSNIVTVDGIEVNERGADGLVQSATWSNNGYYYQIITGETAKMEREYVESLISKIN